LDRTNELEAQVQRLTGDVDDMRARMAALEAGEPKQNNGSRPSSRRGFLRLGAAAALGAVGWAAAKVVPASAANAGSAVLGTANLAASPTTIKGDIEAGPIGPPVQVLAAIDSTFNSTDLGTAGGFFGTLQGLGAHTGTVEGVDGWAQGALAYGVYGLTDSGTGVVGESNTGIGLYARRSGRIRQEGLALAGAPSYTPSPFEQVRDANGILWIHGTTGTLQAAWRRVNSLRFDTADGTGGFFKPFRLVDTRSGAPKASSSRNTHVVAGQGSGASLIPADAVGVVGNLVAISYTSVGFLTIMPSGVPYNPATDTASVNFITGQGATGNSFAVGIGAGGGVDVFVGTPGTSHYVIDITGYIQ
jgi:hypothetical protein